nr:ATP-dependent DNA helicase PIF1-like [Tanacetum cinerariifolium]
AVEPTNITMLKDVDPMLDNITVQGRCISLWHSHRLNEAHNPYSLDMVLQDSQDNDEGFTTPVNQVKSANFIDPSINRVLNMQTPSSGSEGSGSGGSSGTIKRRLKPTNDNDLDINRPKVVWEKTWTVMAQDVLFVERIKQNKQDKLKEQHVKLYGSLTSEQKDIYSTVMNAVNNDKGGMFFVYGYGGTGKTIHKENEWAYIGCKKCNKKVNVVESKASSSNGKNKVTFYCEEDGAVKVASSINRVLNMQTPTSGSEGSGSGGISGTIKRRLKPTNDNDSDINRPKVVWEKTWTVMAQDVLFVERIKQNKQDKLKEQHVKLYGSLTSEQKDIYSTVMNAVNNDKGGMFFVYGYGGTGKTYVYKTMSAALRSKGEIVFNVASSGITASLLEGGRTTHSRFAIPINDEAPMVNRHCYEAFDRTLCDICRTDTTVASDKEKSILAPTHEMVDIINQRMLSLLIEFLNGIRMSGIPYHSIKLKTGTPIMLMRNIDQRSGLCNGTRLQVLRMGENIIEAKIITGTSAGTICVIPRMIISPTDTRCPSN